MDGLINSEEIIDNILAAYQPALGTHFTKYRNHVYRVFNIAVCLSKAEGKSYAALAVAAVFHDLGIWTDHTFNYLGPSVALAQKYIAQSMPQVSEQMVADIINNHHKLTAYKADVLTEAFRRADMVDLSCTIIKSGVPTGYLQVLKRAFPYRGFHRFIAIQAVKNSSIILLALYPWLSGEANYSYDALYPLQF